ncbi:ABC-2 type transport system permease protein [Thermocatellispora tengchongensis]|uniref:ABC-2 type transport system permease protein n=1 Tax=Thermocatellispora tengchongensis TaxID=1073253 RepID=A0A840PNQ8_9ACTN|nr:ABC transporter permease [Thermocatellispora tengchongensis]MBB5139411.1 ABC-2 type transport system permease protein [Thermocatellispora tengchongensis]
MTATPAPGPTGVIHDIGYRHYDGPLLGRRQAFGALTGYSLRGVFGLGRPARAKIMPFMLAVIMLMPAALGIAIMALAKETFVGYTGYAVQMQVVLAIFVAAQSPYLVAPDLRFRVLPLYLSRPVTVRDYVGAKLAALITAMFLLLAIPLTVMYAGELLIDLPGAPRTSDYLASVTTALIHAVVLACIGLAIASFTPRRGLGVAAVIAFFLLTAATSTVVAAVLYELGSAGAGWALLINPFHMVDAVQVWLFGTPSSFADIPYPDGIGGPAAALGVIALIALSLAALTARYRKAASA